MTRQPPNETNGPAPAGPAIAMATSSDGVMFVAMAELLKLRGRLQAAREILDSGSGEASRPAERRPVRCPGTSEVA